MLQEGKQPKCQDLTFWNRRRWLWISQGRERKFRVQQIHGQVISSYGWAGSTTLHQDGDATSAVLVLLLLLIYMFSYLHLEWNEVIFLCSEMLMILRFILIKQSGIW